MATGTITFESNFGEMIFLTPGAQQGGSSSDQIPEYNNPMGIFNLLELPKVEYLEYEPNVTRLFSADSQIGKSQLPKIRYYKLAEDLKYVLNPSAGFELVDIKGSFLFDLDKNNNVVPPVPPSGRTPILALSGTDSYFNYGPYGPVLLGSTTNDLTETSNYEAELNEYGLEIDFWKNQGDLDINDIRYKTKNLPIGALTDAGFLIYKYDDVTEDNVTYDHFTHEPNVLLKLTLVLKRTDNPDAKEVLLITTYKTNIVEGSPSPSNINPAYNLHSTTIAPFARIDKLLSGSRFRTNYTVQPTPDGWIWKNIFLDYPRISNIVGTGLNTVTINGTPTTITDDFTNNNIFFAWEQLNLTGDFNFDFDVEFRAQDEVNDKTTSGVFSSSSFDITLKVDAFPPEADRVVNEVSASDLSSFCSDPSKYKPDFSISTIQSPSPNNDIFQVKLYPNPFRTGFTVKYEVNEPGDITFNLYNSIGALIKTIEINQSFVGTYDQQIDTRNLPNGVYVITIETASGLSTAKITKFQK